MKQLVSCLCVAGCLGMLPGAAASQYLRDQERVVSSGHSQKIAWTLYLDPACHSMGMASVTFLDPPKLGQITLRQGQEYPSFNAFNARARCNTRTVPATQFIYSTAPGTVGDDTFAIEYVGPLGNPLRQRFHVVVR